MNAPPLPGPLLHPMEARELIGLRLNHAGLERCERRAPELGAHTASVLTATVFRGLAIAALQIFILSSLGFEGTPIDTGASPHARVHSVGLEEVHWTRGFWADRFELCRRQMIPGMWVLMEGTNYSSYFQNFRIAAGLAEGRHRGPLVYCLESTDLPRGVRLVDVLIPANVDLVARYDNRLLNGVVIVEGKVFARPPSDWSGQLYREFAPKPAKSIAARFIPYFAWSNRGKSEMSVWLPVGGQKSH